MATKEEYFKFLIQVLQTNAQSGSAPQLVYPLLQKNLDKLDSNLAEIMYNFFTTNLPKVTLEDARHSAGHLANLSILFQEVTFGDKSNNLQISIAGYQIALQVYTLKDTPEQWAVIHSNMLWAYVELYRISGNWSESIEEAITTSETALPILNVFPHQQAQIQVNLANALIYRPHNDKSENLAKAVELCEKATLVYNEINFPEQWSRVQNTLGLAYRFAYRDCILGDWTENIERAVGHYKKALKALEALPYGQYLNLWVTILINLGNTYQEIVEGKKYLNLKQAITCYENALQAFSPEVSLEQWATIHINLGNAYLAMGEIHNDSERFFQHAINCYEAALKVFKVEKFPEEWARVTSNLGNAYQELSRFEFPKSLEIAIDCYERVLGVYTPNASPTEWALTHNNLGYAYEKCQNFSEAIKSFKLAIKFLTPTTFPLDCLRSGRGLGDVAFKTEQWQTAIEGYTDAIDALERLRMGTILEFRRQQVLASAIGIYEKMVQACINNNELNKAIEYVERSKTRNLVELLATSDLYPKGNIPETVINELSRLRRGINSEQKRLEIEEKNRNILGSIMSESYLFEETSFLSKRTHLNQLQQQLDELITRDIKPIDPNFSLTQKVEPIAYSEIQSLTGENTAILEWYITDDKFLTFIITPQSPTPIIWQSSTADLEKLIRWGNGYLRAYRKKKKDQWKRRLNVRLRLLAKILHLDEILENIPKHCEQLILIPHRYLHLFPLHALPVSRETWLQFNPNSDSSPANPYLLDCFVGGVGYAPSCQLLQQAQMRQRPNFSHLFAIANPTSDRYLLELQAANIRHQFQSNDFLAKDDANKDAILNGKLSLANCAHFGCHGKFEPDSPLESALKLANNEHLTLLEILNLDLNQCRLVTLSACETGLTESSTSDEYIGLPFGFLLAGSPSMVSTLWEVDQLASTLLLMRFYKNIETLSTVTALNEAQQWLRNLTSEELEAELERLKPQIDQTFEQLPLKERTRYVNAPLNGARNRQPLPFAEPHYWAGFTAIGV